MRMQFAISNPVKAVKYFLLMFFCNSNTIIFY